MIKTLLAVPAALLLTAGLALGANFEAIDEPAAETPASDKSPADDQKNTECVDDPRLETDIMEIMESDGPIRPLIKVTPETYITMNKSLLDRLAGNAIICPKTPLLKDGSLAGKVSIEFPLLWNQLQTAISSQDMERAKWLVANFQSRPMSPNEIINLVTKVGMAEKMGESLYKLVNREPGYFPSVIDFFIYTGGRTSEPASVYIGFSPREQEEIRKEAGDSGNVIFADNLLHYISKSGTQSAMADKLRSTGLTATPKRP